MSIYYPEGCDQDVAQEAIRTLARVINKMHQHRMDLKEEQSDVKCATIKHFQMTPAELVCVVEIDVKMKPMSPTNMVKKGLL